MKKLWFLSVIGTLAIALILFSSCSNDGDGGGGEGTGSFTYDGTTYTITNGYIDDWSILGEPDFDITLATAGLDAWEWTGTGDYVYLDLVAPSSIGQAGTYDWAATGGFELFDCGIGLNWVASSDTGTWINGDFGLASGADYVTISKSGSTYTIDFSITLDDGKVVTGNYTGTLPIWVITS